MPIYKLNMTRRKVQRTPEEEEIFQHQKRARITANQRARRAAKRTKCLKIHDIQGSIIHDKPLEIVQSMECQLSMEETIKVESAPTNHLPECKKEEVKDEPYEEIDVKDEFIVDEDLEHDETESTEQDHSPEFIADTKDFGDTSGVDVETYYPHGSVVINRGRIGQVEVSPSKSPPAKRSKRSSDLLDLLDKSAEGKCIRALYEKTGFDNRLRNRLAHLIITAEYGADTNTVISTARFKELAATIIECFPDEDESTFYVPAYTPAKGKTIVARGKLYDQYTYLNKDLRDASLRQLRPAQSYIDDDVQFLPVPADTKSIDASLTFLERNLHPWEAVVDHWKVTTASRINTLLLNPSPKTNIQPYLDKYPCLKQKKGYELLLLDFDKRFPEASLRIYSHWEAFSVKVRALLLKQGITSDCDSDLLQKFAGLFSIIPVKIPGRKPWRANRPSIVQGFLHFIPKSRDYQKEIEDLDKEAKEKGFNLQPFPLLVGDSITEVESSYFVIDGKLTLLETPLRAFEVAFKSYFALHSEFPIQSQRLWIVIQKTLFNIHLPCDRANPLANLPDVKRLIKALEC